MHPWVRGWKIQGFRWTMSIGSKNNGVLLKVRGRYDLKQTKVENLGNISFSTFDVENHKLIEFICQLMYKWKQEKSKEECEDVLNVVDEKASDEFLYSNIH